MKNAFPDSLFPEVDAYLVKMIPPRDSVLKRMERYAASRGFPYIGPLAGELLALLAKSIKAKKVFEMGSGFGFSALHFARALEPGGRVICTDGDPQNAEKAREFFEQAELPDRMEFHVGDAVEILKKIGGTYDIILMDIDKEDYPEAFREAWPHVREGGLFIADNLMWHGRVMTDDQRKSTVAIKKFSRMLYATPNAKTTILPLRDGLSVTLKLKAATE